MSNKDFLLSCYFQLLEVNVQFYASSPSENSLNEAVTRRHRQCGYYVKCPKDGCLWSEVARCVYLFFSAQQLSPKHLGCLTRREQCFTAVAPASAKCRARASGIPASDARGTCRSSVTGCPSGDQQLHRVVHKHRGRIKGGGTLRSSINDNNWFSVSRLPSAEMPPSCFSSRPGIGGGDDGAESSADTSVVASNRRTCQSPLVTPPHRDCSPSFDCTTSWLLALLNAG